MKLEWEKMAKLFEAKGVTAYKVAKDLGFSQSMFPRWRDGKGYPKHDKIQQIAEYFGVDDSYFYEREFETPSYLSELMTNYVAQALRDDQKELMKSASDLTEEQVQAVELFIKALKGEAKSGY